MLKLMFGMLEGTLVSISIITHQEKIEHKMHCLIISVGYTFPPDYLWYRGSATADKVLKYYVIVLYFLYKMVFGMYIIARGGKSQLVLARPSCVFSGSSQIVISSWLGEPERANSFT